MEKAYGERMLDSMVTERVTDVIYSFLKKEGITHIFGIPGGYNAFLMDALYDYPDFQFVRTQHEEGAAFMADGYAKAAGHFGVVFTTAGPGMTNSLTGMVSSLADGVPVLYISGGIPGGKMLKGAIQDTNSFGMNMSVVMREAVQFYADVTSPGAFMQYFRNSIRHLFKGKRGPVMLNVSADVFNQNVEHYYDYTGYFPDRAFDQTNADFALEELLKAKSLVIVSGNGVILSEAQREVSLLARELQAPVVVTPKGKSSINNESPWFMGMFGAGTNVIPREYFKNERVDTVLAIGTSFNEYSSDTWSNTLQSVKRIIHIDIDPYVIGRSFGQTIGVVGDAKSVIHHFLEKLSTTYEGKYTHLNASERLQQYRDRYNNFDNPEKYDSESAPIKVPRLLRDIYESLYDRQVNIFNDNGACIFWMNHYMKLRKGWNMFSSLGFSSMGYAIPAAIGGSFATPQRVTLAVAGDGAAAMNGNELKTAAEYNSPAMFVVLNDSRMNIIHHGTSAMFGRPHKELGYRDTFDFVKFAESMGVRGILVDTPGQINKSLMDELIAEGKPVLFDCRIDATDMAPFGGRIHSNRQREIEKRDVDL